MSKSEAPTGMTVPPPDDEEEVDVDAAFEEEVTGKVSLDQLRLKRSVHEVELARTSITQKMRALRDRLERSRGYVWVDREHIARRSRPDFG